MFNQDHAKRCKKDLAECKVCQFNIEQALRMNPQDLNSLLENPMAPPLKVRVAAMGIENLIARTMHDSKRGQGDVALGMKVLKGYEKRGGSL